MKGREGLIRVWRFCSNSRERGSRVGGFIVPREICFGSSFSPDDYTLNPASNSGQGLWSKGFKDRVLSASFADLESSTSVLSFARYIASLTDSPHIGAGFRSPLQSQSACAQIFSSSFQVLAVPFASSTDRWQEDKEDEEDKELEGHEKQGPSEILNQWRRETQVSHTGRDPGSQKPILNEVSESDVLIGNGKALFSSKVREDVRKELGWSEMGWSRQEVLNWPNAISMARLLCGLPLSWMIVHEHWTPAFVGLVAAGISDWLDGYVARRMGINSVLGSYLDPVADKFLVGSVAVSMAYMGLLHPVLVGLIVARDGVLMGGAFVYRAYSLNWRWKDWQEFLKISIGGAGKVEPLYISKVNTVFQLVLVGVALLQPALSMEDIYSIVPLLSGTVVVTTTLSWAAYAYIYLKNPANLAALRRVAHPVGSKTAQGSS